MKPSEKSRKPPSNALPMDRFVIVSNRADFYRLMFPSMIPSALFSEGTKVCYVFLDENRMIVQVADRVFPNYTLQQYSKTPRLIAGIPAPLVGLLGGERIGTFDIVGNHLYVRFHGLLPNSTTTTVQHSFLPPDTGYS